MRRRHRQFHYGRKRNWFAALVREDDREELLGVKSPVKRIVKRDVKKSVSQKKDVKKSVGPVERRLYVGAGLHGFLTVLRTVSHALLHGVLHGVFHGVFHAVRWSNYQTTVWAYCRFYSAIKTPLAPHH